MGDPSNELLLTARVDQPHGRRSALQRILESRTYAYVSSVANLTSIGVGTLAIVVGLSKENIPVTAVGSGMVTLSLYVLQDIVMRGFGKSRI